MCRFAEGREALEEARALLWIGCGVMTVIPTSQTHLHHPEKPFEFYYLGCRKKLTPGALGP